MHTHTHTGEGGKQTSGESEHPVFSSTNTTSSAAANHINLAAYIE